MLHLTRRENQEIYIDGGRIKILVVEVRGGQVRLGFEAPLDVAIDRAEMLKTLAEFDGGKRKKRTVSRQLESPGIPETKDR